MLSWIVGLFITGAVCIFFEAILPGAIAGIIGGVLLLTGTSLAFAGYGVQGGLLALGASLAIVGVTLWLEFRLLPKTAFGRRFFLTSTNTATAAPQAEDWQALVGKTAVTATPLRPSGVVLIDGRRCEAHSASGFLERDSAVRVVGADAFKVTVVRA